MLAAVLQQSATAITAPANGQILPAQVTIRGTIEAASFAFAELAFGYVLDPTDTWFLIQLISQPPQEEVLAVWDTTGLADGDYRLRLRVFAPDGSYKDAFVTDLHLRSELPPTATVTPGVTGTVVTPEAAPTSEPPATELPPTQMPALTPVLSTPPLLPPNPAAMSTESVYSVLGRGALLTLILFLVMGLFLRLRHT